MRRYVPSLHTLVLIFVVVSGSNFGIATLQHVLAVHSAADTPAPPDATTARPTIADRSHRRCDDARAPRGHKPPPTARSTEATPTLPTETIGRTIDQKSRYVGRRTTTTTRPFVSSSSLSSSSRPSSSRAPSLLGGGRGDGGAGSDAVSTFAVTPGPRQEAS